MKTSLLKKMTAALFALFLFAAGGSALAGDAPPKAKGAAAGQVAASDVPLRVHFLDVGQGDSILIVSPTGKTVLVDAGTSDSTKELLIRLQEISPKPFDLMVMTHPHADHIGGMAAVLEKQGALRFLDPGFDHASKLYDKVLKALEELSIPVQLGQKGRKIDIGGGAYLEVLAPSKPLHKGTRSDANANSIVMRLVYGETSFYLAGDSESDTETRILEEAAAEKRSIESTVYKVAHHGSRHSSGNPLLQAMKPKYAVFSAGRDNRYGHPTQEALGRCRKIGAEIYRTDVNGEIIMFSDGKSIEVKPQNTGKPGIGDAFIEAGAPAGTAADVAPAPTASVAAAGSEGAPALAASAAGFVGSKKGKAYHAASCRNANRIKADNVVRYATSEEAEAASKTPARCCLGGGSKSTKAAGSSGVTEEPNGGGSAVERPTTGYVSSKNSKSFHKAGCKGANRIKPTNLVTYPTREEAVASGRNPAKDCKP